MDATVPGTAACVLPTHRHYPNWYGPAPHQLAQTPPSSFLPFGTAGQGSPMMATNQATNPAPMYNLHPSYHHYGGNTGGASAMMSHSFHHPSATFAPGGGGVGDPNGQLGSMTAPMNFPTLMFNMERSSEGLKLLICNF